uniref:Predicted protein n=1 Tax=Hordeum vulgare subsp. vulgare TaxID=112509 RepID=F2CSM3_HORVV|nr:predicted protein [Hordeum vulgare subsp. vulgare]
MYVLERAADNASLPENDYALPLGKPEDSFGETDSEETGSSADKYADAEEADTVAMVRVDSAHTILSHPLFPALVRTSTHPLGV